MSVKNGPTLENINMIHDKAKKKKDGVYSFRGLLYRVKDCRFTHYCYRREIFERSGYFNVYLGSTIHEREALRNLH